MEEFTSKKGFLFKKSAQIQRWRLRWLVLDGGARTLTSYNDEMESSQTGKLTLHRSIVIETMPSECQENQYVFTVSDPLTTGSDRPMILCASDSSTIESWMLHLIQVSQGSWRESENFCVAPKNADDALDNADAMKASARDSWVGSELGEDNEDNEYTLEDDSGVHDPGSVLPIKGYLRKKHYLTQVHL